MTLNKQQLTLNCDMGESFGSWSMGADEDVMPHVDMANIACGFHASDPNVM
ncbi:LamB/YcsF family protein, partial [Vibrio parahaemolyticus]|nr:LamB/YcsF family protein [Vibrio parahaemolyticus]